MKTIYIILIKFVILGFACKSNSAIKSPQTLPSSSIKISLANLEFFDGEIFISAGVLGHSYGYKFGDTSYHKTIYLHYNEPYQTLLMESGNYEIEKLYLTFKPKIKMFCRIASFIENMDCNLNGDYLNGYYVNIDTLNEQKIVDLGFLPKKTEISFENGKMVFKDPGTYVRYQEIKL